jgi:hypothetical protein
METARKVGTFKNFVAGRASEATVVSAFEKHSAVLRYLGAIDPTGEVHTDLNFLFFSFLFLIEGLAFGLEID